MSTLLSPTTKKTFKADEVFDSSGEEFKESKARQPFKKKTTTTNKKRDWRKKK